MGGSISSTDLEALERAVEIMARLSYDGSRRPMLRQPPFRRGWEPMRALQSAPVASHHAVQPGRASHGLALLHGSYAGAFAAQLAHERELPNQF